VTNNALQITPGYIAGLIDDAYARIQPHLLHTRLLLDQENRLFLKCENEQTTGSFKWRGALAKLSLFEPGQFIVTASTGNHGLGIANAAILYGLKAKIFIPSTASPQKIEKLLKLGADITKVDGDSLFAETSGKAYAAQHGLPWVSPYNDVDVISGQGTIGFELTKDLPEVNKVYITVGGGGLISGIGSWIKSEIPNVKVIGCQPLNSPEMYLSVQAGHVVNAPEELPTLSDGSAGPLEEDSITFPLCRALVDRFILVTESEIEDAIRYLFQNHQLVVEGAAAVAMAAAMKDDKHMPGDQSVVILCGGNIDPAVHQRICNPS
jgi:threonine dehydratase